MKSIFFLLVLIIFTSEQNFNQVNSNINQNNQNSLNIKNQYRNTEQYRNNPQNNHYIQNQHVLNQFLNQYGQNQQIGKN